MKTNKTLTLDTDVVERLRDEPNASGLVNKMIIEHYNMQSYREMTDDDKLKEIDKRIEIAKLEEQIKEKRCKLKS